MLTEMLDVGLVRRSRGIAAQHRMRTKATEFAANPFASGDPTVSGPELRTGGLQEG